MRRRRRRTRWPCASRCATSSDATRFSVLHATPAPVGPRCLRPPARASLPAGFFIVPRRFAARVRQRPSRRTGPARSTASRKSTKIASGLSCPLVPVSVLRTRRYVRRGRGIRPAAHVSPRSGRSPISPARDEGRSRWRIAHNSLQFRVKPVDMICLSPSGQHRHQPSRGREPQRARTARRPQRIGGDDNGAQ